MEFINKKGTNGGIDNMTIGELKGIIKSMATSEDILNGFLESILKEIGSRADADLVYEIRELIEKMNSKDLPFGTEAAGIYGIMGTGEDKLPVVKNFLSMMGDLVKKAQNTRRRGGKREKSKSMTLKKRNLRRKSRKNGKNKRKKKASRK